MRHVEDFITGLILMFLEAWMLMLFLGGIHHDVLDSVRPIGYWTAFYISIPLGILFSSYQSVQSVKIDKIYTATVGK